MQQISQPPLNEGETYISLIGAANSEAYHLVLLPSDNDDAGWQAQMDWAKSIGGDLPDRVEQAMLFKHFKPEFKERAYWSNTVEEDGWAWFQYFSSGYQDLTHMYYALRARAVRRLPI